MTRASDYSPDRSCRRDPNPCGDFEANYGPRVGAPALGIGRGTDARLQRVDGFAREVLVVGMDEIDPAVTEEFFDLTA